MPLHGPYIRLKRKKLIQGLDYTYFVMKLLSRVEENLSMTLV